MAGTCGRYKCFGREIGIPVIKNRRIVPDGRPMIAIAAWLGYVWIIRYGDNGINKNRIKIKSIKFKEKSRGAEIK